MAKCKFCGEWAGIASDQHDDCAEASASGKTVDQIRVMRNVAAASSAAPTPLSMRHIVGGVYFGTLLASITLGILYWIISSLNR